jgi:DNA (cytosine-5)-methyltransferase 1
MDSFKMVDLFAGCGGLTEGFKLQGGFKTVGSVEWDKYASDTLINRLKKKWGYKNAEEIVLRYDIQKTVQLLDGYKSSEYGNSIGLKSIIKNAGGCDLVIGGPPCQAYSVAGRVRDENGMHNDYRNYLFESYLSTIKGIGSPPVILFENVPGMLSASPGGVSIIDRITEAFNRSGYIITDDIKQNALFNVADYGVPQNRKRVILIGLNKKTFGKNSGLHLDKIYESIHSTKKDIKATVSSALEGLDKFYPLTTEKKINGKRFSHGPVEGNFSNSIPRYHSRRDISIFKELTTDIVQGTKKYSTTDALKDLYTRKTGKKSADS